MKNTFEEMKGKLCKYENKKPKKLNFKNMQKRPKQI